jgi:hypothetical protein
MIDSIIFRIHNRVLHEGLWDFLEKPDEGTKQMVKKFDEPESRKREFHIQRYFVDVASGRSWQENYRNFIKSHHYHIAYSLNQDRDFIEFNFSIPKYKYGTNVLQLVDHIDEDKYLSYINTEFWDCAPMVYEKFLNELRRFITHNLGGLYDSKTRTGLVHVEFLELERIDLCYNILFNTQSDCEYYLSQIRSVKRRGLRDTSKQSDYLKGIYSYSKDYTLKIYHKGSEFQKHDYNKVKKRYGQKLADQILRSANKMMRFEIEYRGGYLTELFRTNLKNTNPYIHECVSISRAMSTNGYFLHQGTRYSYDGHPQQGFTCAKLTPEFKSKLKLGKKLRAKDSTFWFSMNDNYSLNNLSPIDAYQYDFKERFSKNLFLLLVKNFKKQFLRYQLNDYNAMNQLNILLKEKNESDFKIALREIGGETVNIRNYSLRKLKLFMNLLKDNTWDQIKSKKLFSDSLFYRYKKLFRLLGYQGQRTTDYDFKVKFDYSNYYNEINDWYWGLGVKNSR